MFEKIGSSENSNNKQSAMLPKRSWLDIYFQFNVYITQESSVELHTRLLPLRLLYILRTLALYIRLL